jgi:hypothetical protein
MGGVCTWRCMLKSRPACCEAASPPRLEQPLCATSVSSATRTCTQQDGQTHLAAATVPPAAPGAGTPSREQALTGPETRGYVMGWEVGTLGTYSFAGGQKEAHGAGQEGVLRALRGSSGLRARA